MSRLQVPKQSSPPVPECFEPSKQFLYAANEQGDTVVSWRADASTGRLTPVGQPMQNASPVTIAFATL